MFDELDSLRCPECERLNAPKLADGDTYYYECHHCDCVFEELNSRVTVLTHGEYYVETPQDALIAYYDHMEEA